MSVDDVDVGRRRVQHPGGGPSRVKQGDQAAVDAKTLVRRWAQTGTVVQMTQEPRYGDFQGVVDFHASLERIRQAEEEFMRLPARVRTAAGNDPGQFLELCQNADWVRDMFDLGLKPEDVPGPAPDPGPEPAPPVPTPGPASG